MGIVQLGQIQSDARHDGLATATVPFGERPRLTESADFDQGFFPSETWIKPPAR